MCLTIFVQLARSLMLHFRCSGWTCTWGSQVGERSIRLQDLGRTFPHWVCFIISDPSEEKSEYMSRDARAFPPIFVEKEVGHVVFHKTPEYGAGGTTIPSSGVSMKCRSLLFIHYIHSRNCEIFTFMRHEATHDVAVCIYSFNSNFKCRL